ncbi:hypothetical protein BaRGS_00032946, partial [Batillaria attramentaria]
MHTLTTSHRQNDPTRSDATLEELSKAIDSLSCGKAPGKDGIPPEVLKSGANFQGHISGVAQRITEKVLAALSVHCLAHCVNMASTWQFRKQPE